MDTWAVWEPVLPLLECDHTCSRLGRTRRRRPLPATRHPHRDRRADQRVHCPPM